MFALVLKKIIHYFMPPPICRDEAEQAMIDAQTKHLKLYHFSGCPYCMGVRRHIRQLSLNIEMYNIQQDTQAQQALVKGGGMTQVPCLRIENAQGKVQWMYESHDIVQYLKHRFIVDKL